jgi:hypothetical protein
MESERSRLLDDLSALRKERDILRSRMESQLATGQTTLKRKRNGRFAPKSRSTPKEQRQDVDLDLDGEDAVSELDHNLNVDASITGTTPISPSFPVIPER